MHLRSHRHHAGPRPPRGHETGRPSRCRLLAALAAPLVSSRNPPRAPAQLPSPLAAGAPGLLCHRGCPGRGAAASNFTLGATVFPNTGIPMSATQQHSLLRGGGSLAVRPRAQPSEAVPGHSSDPIQCPTYLGAETPSQSRISCSADCHRPPGSCYRGREGDSPWPQRRWEQSRERPHAGHRCRIAGAGPRPEAHQNLPRSPCRSTPIQLGTGWPRAGRRPESQPAATSHLSPGLRLSPPPPTSDAQRKPGPGTQPGQAGVPLLAARGPACHRGSALRL